MGRSSKFVRRLTQCALAVAILATAAAPAAAALGDEIYSTDFSDPDEASQEWGFADGATSERGTGYSLELTPGALEVHLTKVPNFWVTPDAGSLPDDQVVETTIEEATGDDSTTAGVACRGSLDDDLGYLFLIGTDGYYTIGDISGTAHALVNKNGKKRSDAIDPSGPNTVRGECVDAGKRGVRLTMYVNDEKVASVVDPDASPVGTSAYVVVEVDRSRPANVSFSSFSVAAA